MILLDCPRFVGISAFWGFGSQERPNPRRDPHPPVMLKRPCCWLLDQFAAYRFFLAGTTCFAFFGGKEEDLRFCGGKEEDLRTTKQKCIFGTFCCPFFQGHF